MSTSVRSRARCWIMPRPIRGMVLGALLTLSATTPAWAGDWSATAGSTDLFAPFPVIGHDEMARLRGGFNVAGLNLEFGANVRTLIDNVVRLETVVHFTQAGIVSTPANLTQLAGGAPAAGGAQLANVAQQTAELVKNMAKGAVNGAGAAAHQSSSADGRMQGRTTIDLGALSSLSDLANRIKGENPASSAGSAAANGAGARQTGTIAGPTVSKLGSGGAQLDFSGLGDNIRGVVLNDTKGLTAAIQGITRDHIVSTIINQANDRRIQVQLNLQIDIKNFSQYSAALRNSLLNQRLAQPNHNL